MFNNTKRPALSSSLPKWPSPSLPIHLAPLTLFPLASLLDFPIPTPHKKATLNAIPNHVIPKFVQSWNLHSCTFQNAGPNTRYAAYRCPTSENKIENTTARHMRRSEVMRSTSTSKSANCAYRLASCASRRLLTGDNAEPGVYTEGGTMVWRYEGVRNKAR